MDHICAGRGLRLSYIRDAEAIEGIVRECNPEAPPSGTLASLALRRALRRYPLAINHVVLAMDSGSWRHQGFQVAHSGVAGHEPFLLLDATLMCAEANRAAVLRRMVALAILRLVGAGQPPTVIAIRSDTPGLCEVLHDLSRHVDAAALYPEPRANVVSLPIAALAHRIARSIGARPRFEATASAMSRFRTKQLGWSPGEAAGPLMAVLDLRTVSESALIAGARWLYRSRPPRPQGMESRAEAAAGTVAALPGGGR
jgi:hypothetical protein